ncbi:DUF6934 family protein [Chitinophaga sp. RAB17]|uniref:DUF6934 family protein n=1 Tax=Chitinophaga sp. RAB17 TaxID=3233049 RepID=UPI003F90A396
MKYEKYESLLISKDALEFKFISEGPKGEIQKVVQFIETENPDIYNLAFGDLMTKGEVNDAVKNDNKDRNKVLATVAATVYEFTARYSDKYVFFTGSTPERTRLYRMAIANNLDELNVDFEIYGVVLINGLYIVKPFVKSVTYFGFLIKRKKD